MDHKYAFGVFVKVSGNPEMVPVRNLKATDEDEANRMFRYSVVKYRAQHPELAVEWAELVAGLGPTGLRRAVWDFRDQPEPEPDSH